MRPGGGEVAGYTCGAGGGGRIHSRGHRRARVRVFNWRWRRTLENGIRVSDSGGARLGLVTDTFFQKLSEDPRAVRVREPP